MHEGPARISKLGTTPLKRGMILSNEPGYYKTDAFGIRIENLEWSSTQTSRRREAGERVRDADAGADRPPLIDVAMLSDELNWLNAYHARVPRGRPQLDDKAAKHGWTSERAGCRFRVSLLRCRPPRTG